MKYNKGLENTDLIVRKTSIFEKIASFFIGIFKKDNGKDELSCHQSFDTSKNIKKEDFQNNIKVECDYEEERLLNLQKQFENNIITEEEISVNDRIELKGLYYMQILKSKIKIELYKEKIRKNKILTE